MTEINSSHVHFSPIPEIGEDLSEIMREVISSLKDEDLTDLENVSDQFVLEDLLATSERFRIQKIDKDNFKIMYRKQGSVETEWVKSLISNEIPRLPFDLIQILVNSRTVTYFELTNATLFPNCRTNVLVDFNSKFSFINSLMLVPNYPVLPTINYTFEIQWGAISKFESNNKALIYLNGKMGSSFMLDAFVVDGGIFQNSQTPWIILGQDFLKKYLKATRTEGGINYFYFEDSFGFIHKVEYYLVCGAFSGSNN